MNIDDDKLTGAIAIACYAHHGQVDKGGSPYILHPIRVMMKMRTLVEKIVAVLHDAAEDNKEIIIEELRKLFGDDVCSALELLKKRPGESKLDNAKRICNEPNEAVRRIAINVKIEDVTDNMDGSRLPQPTTQEDEARYQQYLVVYRFLQEYRANLGLTQNKEI